MGSIRIRLCFAPELALKLREPCKQCWMLVDVERCKCVYDLEFLIQTKFFTEKKGISLSLYLDDFLLPSKEKIQIIRENDVIRLVGILVKYKVLKGGIPVYCHHPPGIRWSIDTFGFPQNGSLLFF